jgi:hypothetical protein
MRMKRKLSYYVFLSSGATKSFRTFDKAVKFFCAQYDQGKNYPIIQIRYLRNGEEIHSKV